MKFCTLTLLMFTSVIAFCNVVPSFSCSATKGCSPLVVNITDQSTGGATTWSWDLGNGNTSTQQNPAATYFTPGNYTIKLVVSDGRSTDSITKVITVFGNPVADFSSDKVKACMNDTVRFAASQVSGAAPLSQYAWGFGNGRGSDSVSTYYQYNQSGIFDVTLVVLDTNGCTANITKPAYIQIWDVPTAACTVSPAASCGTSQLVTCTDQSQGNGLSYLWSFGDSGTSTQANTTHTFQYGKYNTVLTVTNNKGCKSTAKHNVAIINLKANFTADKTTACAGEKISFTNLSPMPGSSWSWSFGDTGTSNKINPQHIYTTPGVYAVTFVIKDAMCQDSVTKVAYIHITPGFTVAFTPDHRNSCSAPFTVHYTSTVSTSVHYLWDLGNGVADSTANPTTTYTTPSVYSVTLTAIDSNGCTVVTSAPGLISASRPLVKFTADTLLCPHQSGGFLNATLQASSYVWHFGDGDSSIGVNPHHVYRSNGRFNVSLTAVDSFGCDSTLTKPGFIHVDIARVDLKVDHAFSNCPPLVTSFKSITNRNDLKLTWDFGDGYTDTAVNPTHIFFQPGMYTVKLIGVSGGGCSDTISYPQLINVQGPSGTFKITSNNGCTPLVVNFAGSVSANTEIITCDLGNGTLLSGSANFNYTYNTPRVYHPKFVLTDHVGCSIPFDLDSIIGLPSPTLALHDTSVCLGQSVQVSLGADHYSWTGKVCDTCGRVPDTADSSSIATLAPPVNTTYNVTATNIYGCTATGQFKIDVKQLQILPAHDTIKLCKSESAQLSCVRADSVRWTPMTFLNDFTIASPVCLPDASLTYTVMAYTGAGCASSQQVPVKVIDKVTISLTHDSTVCPGGVVHLAATAIDSSMQGVSYSWSPASSLDQSNSADATAQLQSQSQTYTVIAHSGGCTQDTASVTIHVRQAPTIKMPETVVTTTHADVALTAVQDDLTAYLWTAPDSLSCKDCKSTTLVPGNTQIVYLTGTDQYGCSATDSMLIDVLQCDPASIFVPNVFTPNGDGMHDVLYLHSRTLAQMDYFRVFDRWGAMIYESRNIADGWDGMINGKVAEQGVYIYTIKGKCDNGYDVEKNGSVTLIR